MQSVLQATVYTIAAMILIRESFLFAAYYGKLFFMLQDFSLLRIPLSFGGVVLLTCAFGIMRNKS